MIIKEVKCNDKNLLDAVNIFNDLNIKYFLANGSLLGLIRDGDLLPWDNEIDLVIFKSDLNLVLFKILKKKFKIKNFKYVQGNFDSKHIKFKRNEGRVIDINIGFKTFQKNNEIFITQYFFYTKKNLNFFLKFIIFFFNKLKKIFGIFILFQNLRLKLFKYLDLFDKVEYNIPEKFLFNFIHIKINNTLINIPKEYEEVLKAIYGNSWVKKIDKKEYYKKLLPSSKN